MKRYPQVNAIICIGVLIKGDTFHFDVIATAVSEGIMNVSLESEVPIIFGVLTLNNENQAKERIVLANTWADGALSMAKLKGT